MTVTADQKRIFEMRHGSLFSGIGGFDLAAEWMGWENVFHCELNEFGQKILKHYWPNAKSYGDITKTDFTVHRGNIDIITGGFPCQPYSVAGNRKGKEDDRHLWPEMLRAIREVQPSWIVGENVPGLLNWNGGMVLSEIKTDLENEGFEVLPPVIIPACAKDAPHKRDRLWIIAYSSSNGLKHRKSSKNRHTPGEGKIEEVQRQRVRNDIRRISEQGNVTDTIRERRCSRFDKWEYAIHADPSGETFGFRRSVESWPTEPPLCFTDDGISKRLVGTTFSGLRRKAINALGNAIVPQVAYEIFKAIEQVQ